MEAQRNAVAGRWRAPASRGWTGIVSLMLVVALLLVACQDADPDVAAEEPDDEGGVDEPADDDPGAEEPADETDADGDETGETYELRYSSPAAGISVLGTGADWWADRVNELTDGQMSIETFHDSSLLDATETLPGVQDGRTDIGYLVNFFLSDDLPLFDVAGMPFVSEDAEAILHTLDDLYDTNQAFEEEFADQDLHVLFFMPVGSGIMAFTEPVEDIDDLAGKRVRSSGLTAFVSEEVGADPVFLPPTEIFEAVQRGIIDGIVGLDFDLTVAFGYHEAAEQFVQPGLGQYASVAVAINRDLWDSLPSDIQDALDQASEEYMDEIAIDYLNEANERACDRLLEEGGSVSVWDEAATDEWLETVTSERVHDRWLQQVTERGVAEDDAAQFLDEFLAGVESREGTGSYSDGARLCAER